MSVKSFITYALLLLVLVSGCAASEKKEIELQKAILPEPILPEAIEINYFYDTSCGSCDEDQEFYNLFNNLLSDVKNEYQYKVAAYNVFQYDGMEQFVATSDRWGVTTDNLSFPVMFINGKVYAGMENIKRNLYEAFLTAGEDIFVYGSVYSSKNNKESLFSNDGILEDESVVVYFYRITCPECIQTKPIIDALHESISIDGKKSNIKVIRYNSRSGNNADKIRALFNEYKVVSEDQMVPIVFLKNRYLSGYEEISKYLIPALENGEGLGFRFPE